MLTVSTVLLLSGGLSACSGRGSACNAEAWVLAILASGCAMVGVFIWALVASALAVGRTPDGEAAVADGLHPNDEDLASPAAVNHVPADAHASGQSFIPIQSSLPSMVPNDKK